MMLAFVLRKSTKSPSVLRQGHMIAQIGRRGSQREKTITAAARARGNPMRAMRIMRITAQTWTYVVMVGWW